MNTPTSATTPGIGCPYTSGHATTPAGGESGGRLTVRLRGGRAGPFSQESLGEIG